MDTTNEKTQWYHWIDGIHHQWSPKAGCNSQEHHLSISPNPQLFLGQLYALYNSAAPKIRGPFSPHNAYWCRPYEFLLQDKVWAKVGQMHQDHKPCGNQIQFPTNSRLPLTSWVRYDDIWTHRHVPTPYLFELVNPGDKNLLAFANVASNASAVHSRCWFCFSKWRLEKLNNHKQCKPFLPHQNQSPSRKIHWSCKSIPWRSSTWVFLLSLFWVPLKPLQNVREAAAKRNGRARYLSAPPKRTRLEWRC